MVGLRVPQRSRNYASEALTFGPSSRIELSDEKLFLRLQHRNTSKLQQRGDSIRAVQHHRRSASLENNTPVQRHSSAAPQQCSTTTVQHHNSAAPQQISIPGEQHSSATTTPTAIIERGTVKAALTRFRTFLSKSASTTSVGSLKKRLEANIGLHDTFNRVQTRIEILVAGTDAEQLHATERDDFETAYFDLVDQVETFIARSTPNHSRATTVSPISAQATDSNIQRFHYLNSSLKGVAARVIQALGVSETNYKQAWELLKSRYEDSTSLKRHHVNSLLDLKSVQKQSEVTLREFIDDATNHRVALMSLGEPIETWDTTLVPLLSRKLDQVSMREWEKRIISQSKMPSFSQFSAFIEERSKYLANIAVNLPVAAPRVDQRPRVPSNTPRYNYLASHVINTAGCPVCKASHAIYHCERFKNSNLSQKTKIVQEARLCFNCLVSGHQVRACTRSHCKQCGRKHHSLLHNPDSKPVEESYAITADSDSREPPVVVANVANTIGHTVLSTAIVQVKDKKGQAHECRVLLDSGSQANFITTGFCQRLGIKSIAIDSTVTGLGRAANSIKGKATKPNFQMHREKLEIPNHIELADPEFHVQRPIDMLIGAGLFWTLLCVGQHRSQSNLLLQKTQLGYVLSADIAKMYRQILVHPADRKYQRILWRAQPHLPIQEYELNTAGMNLRKWASNCPTVTTTDSTESNREIAVDKDPKTLGLLWSPTTDNLIFIVKPPQNQRITKRTILSEIAQIFDPLGLIGPIVIVAKIILQKLWQIQIGWDRSIPQDLHSQWLQYRQDISQTHPKGRTGLVFTCALEIGQVDGGLLRVGGRLSNAPIDYDQKHPIILPSKHLLTDLIVNHEHHRLMHAGCQAVLTSLQNRVNPLSQSYQMGQLPASRVTPARPFSTWGVDYAGDQRLTFEEFYTLLTQIESCLNSRPLSPLSSDPTDLNPLTPGHFLIGTALTTLPSQDIRDIKVTRLNRYQLVQQMVQHFWQRWQKECIHQLQQRHKWQHPTTLKIAVDSLVIIKEDNLPPLQWSMGTKECMDHTEKSASWMRIHCFYELRKLCAHTFHEDPCSMSQIDRNMHY
ncbi:uncharacterized protein LOC143364062 [Halictus rubicundus]|uniref:uncharacterized protein LOC143364062 n=1 Tax=Halictus rubicundus TaxID=77578 RepID=UPI004036F8CF